MTCTDAILAAFGPTGFLDLSANPTLPTTRRNGCRKSRASWCQGCRLGMAFGDSFEIHVELTAARPGQNPSQIPEPLPARRAIVLSRAIQVPLGFGTYQSRDGEKLPIDSCPLANRTRRQRRPTSVRSKLKTERGSPIVINDSNETIRIGDGPGWNWP